MFPTIQKIKGLHPSIILKRELTHQNIKSSELAKSVDEHKQTISAILNQKRKITPKLSIKLGQFFHIEDDYFSLLQASYDVKTTYSTKQKTPNLNNVRKVLFWDTSFEKIDWNKQKKAVIQRVLERGNDKEINEIISFYGKQLVSNEIKNINSRFTSFKENIKKYHLN
ncbi:MAG: helix-turn-helix domain-containing protein [Flavobacteriaceae bacterium]|nr:helix-turn-helix domain-containing protein [Flavobacteriaceae bacterium]